MLTRVCKHAKHMLYACIERERFQFDVYIGLIRLLTDVLLTIFTAHKEDEIIEAWEFREVHLQKRKQKHTRLERMLEKKQLT